MNKLVTVFQVKEEMTRDYGYMSLDSLQHHTKSKVVDMKPYEVVFGEKNLEGFVFFYTSENKPLALLEKLYRLTNMPTQNDEETLRNYFGYKGRAISTGDIVRIDDTYFYCDSFGWSAVEVKNVPHWIYVGMQASGSYYSDSYPFEVIKVTPSGKTVTIREMDAFLETGNDMNGTAKYRYESNPNGRTYTVRKQKNGNWKTPCNMSIGFGGARKYRDPHF